MPLHERIAELLAGDEVQRPSDVLRAVHLVVEQRDLLMRRESEAKDAEIAELKRQNSELQQKLLAAFRDDFDRERLRLAEAVCEAAAAERAVPFKERTWQMSDAVRDAIAAWRRGAEKGERS